MGEVYQLIRVCLCSHDYSRVYDSILMAHTRLALSLAPHDDDDDLSMHNEIISRRHTIIICGAKWTLELAVSTFLLSQITTIRNGATHACRLKLLRMAWHDDNPEPFFLLFFIHSSFYRVVFARLCVPFLILSMLVKVKFWSH